VFSKTGVDAALEQHRGVVPRLFSACRSAVEADDAEKAVADEAVFAPSNEDEQLEEFVGTTDRAAANAVLMAQVLTHTSFCIVAASDRHGAGARFRAGCGAHARGAAGAARQRRQCALC
jgi:hypothetical protein